jgi:hypothetical protein
MAFFLPPTYFLLYSTNLLYIYIEKHELYDLINILKYIVIAYYSML